MPTHADVTALRPHQLTVNALDTFGGSASASFSLSVSPANKAPVAEHIPNHVCVMGEPFSFDVGFYFIDPDLGQLTFQVTGLPPGTGFQLTKEGIFQGKASLADLNNQPLTITAVAFDDHGLQTQASFHLTVMHSNRKVVAVPIPPMTGYTGEPFLVKMSQFFLDPDSDPITYTISGLPANTGVFFSSTTGTLEGMLNTADRNAQQPIQLKFTATDGRSPDFAEGTLYLTVDARNGPPSAFAVSDAFGMVGTPFYYDVSNSFLDPNDDPLFYTMYGLPVSTGLKIESSTGIISGTPKPMDCAGRQPATITITAKDPSGASASTSLRITLSLIHI